MAVFNATNLIVQVEGKPVGHSTSATFSLNREILDATSKDSSGHFEGIYGVGSGSCTVDALIDYSDDGSTNQGVIYLTDAILAKTFVTLIWGLTASSSIIYTVEALVDSVEQNADAEQVATYSASFTLTGIPAKSTVA